MEKNKTLIILTPGFPENEADSTCVPPQQVFVKVLKETHSDIGIVVLTFQYPFFSDEYYWNGIKVISFNGRNKGKLNRLLLWIKVWKALKRLKKENNIIGLFSFWCTECALLGNYFGKYHSIKHFCWILGQDAKEENKYVKLIRPKPDQLVALSAFLQREFHKNHKILPHHIIPNGIDTTLFTTGNSERDIDVFGAGSLIPLKQYDIFIDIVNELRRSFPSVKALISGKGPEEDNLLSKIKRLKFHGNISLTGESAHQNVLELMQRTKVFLHTSSYEGFSTVCLEALYAGAHVISFWDPMQGQIKHWHIAKDKEEMLKKATEILHDPSIDHSSVMPFSMRDSAKAVISLYTG
jgi:glycosyltransferase involved in cell wall biosynthesis